MKFNHACKLILKNLFLIFILTSGVHGNENVNDKVKKLTLELRCMTCQNQSIYDSDADFSIDIKKLVKQKFHEGKTESEIKKFLVERYGEYILFRPLINFKNLFLWLFPFTMLAIVTVFLIFSAIKK